MPQYILDWGIMVILTMQAWGDWLTIPMNFFTTLGNLETNLLFIATLYWCYDRRLGVRLAVAFTVSSVVFNSCKLIFQAPRPYWVDTRVRLLGRPEISFGLPSGHAQNAVIIWGTLATYGQKLWLWVVAISLMFFIGLSRIYLGVHYPTDVLVGWVIGLITFGLLARLEHPIMEQFNRLGRLQQLGALWAISLLIIISTELIIILIPWSVPFQWTKNAQAIAPQPLFNPFTLTNLIMGAGLFFGFTGGAIWPQNEPTGHWSQRLGSLLIGVIGLLLLWLGLGFIIRYFAETETILKLSLEYSRAVSIGVWISAIAPRLFQRLGLEN